MKRWKNKDAVTVPITDKKDFKTKAVIKDKERTYIIIKGPIQQEGITFINIYIYLIQKHQNI